MTKEKTTERKKHWHLANKAEKGLSNLMLTILAILITIPLFIIAYRYVPDIILPIGEGVRIDHFLTFILVFFIVRLIVGAFGYFFLTVTLIILIVLTVNQIRGGYGFTKLFIHYRDLIMLVESNPVKIPFLKDENMTIRNASKIKEATDYQSPELREFAVKNSLKYFTSKKLHAEYGNVIKYFSLFKSLSKWQYVSDPKGEEYFAKASESSRLMAGDCDDYAILMAACVKAIGGEARLIHTVKHLYPEVKVGKTENFQAIVDLIKRDLFYKESIGKMIYYHTDAENNVWLNFDYTGDYPGAEFMSEEIIGILYI